jgi:hypothetical protein
MLNKDKTSLGVLLGAIAPLLGVFIYYFATFYWRDVAFTQFIGYLKQYKTVLTGVSSISLMANALVFTAYVYAGKDKTLKGIFIATVVYGVMVLLIKWLG